MSNPNIVLALGLVALVIGLVQALGYDRPAAGIAFGLVGAALIGWHIWKRRKRTGA